jgi:hypothetical protein
MAQSRDPLSRDREIAPIQVGCHSELSDFASASYIQTEDLHYKVSFVSALI